MCGHRVIFHISRWSKFMRKVKGPRGAQHSRPLSREFATSPLTQSLISHTSVTGV